MKVAVKKVDALKRELHFEVPGERVAQKMEEVFKDISREAKIKGFRPGKAPRHVVEAEYGALAKEEAIKKIIPEVYQEALQQQDLSPLDYPEIDAVDWSDDVLKFKAMIEIRPEIKIVNYKGIEVSRKSSVVTDEELAKTLEYFQKGREGAQKVDLDDSFVKGLGYPSLDAFKESLKRQMEIDKDRQSRMDVERQITDVLIKNTKMVVPPSLVNKQLEYRMGEITRRLKSQGLSDDEIGKKVSSAGKELKESVERDVRLFLIFDKIAQEEHIEAGQGENLPAKVMEFLMKEAQWKDEGAK